MDKPGAIALAHLATNRDQLRLELAHAEAVLLKAVAKVHHNPGEEDPAVEAARLTCRRIRAEFTHLEQLVDQTTPPMQMELLLRELRALRVSELALRRQARPKEDTPAPPTQRPTHTTAPLAASNEERHVTARLSGSHRFMGMPIGQFDRRTRRQALGLLALIVAYLAYYHIDVQLSILKLPDSGIASWYSRATLPAAPLFSDLGPGCNDAACPPSRRLAPKRIDADARTWFALPHHALIDGIQPAAHLRPVTTGERAMHGIDVVRGKVPAALLRDGEGLGRTQRLQVMLVA